MARVIAIANQKGGVGKTTTAVNLAASLALADQRTLLLDGDPQGNATSGVGVPRDSITRTVYDALIGATSLDAILLRGVGIPLLDVAPATADLAGAEVELVDHPRRDLLMRDAIAPLRGDYDFVLIDCPPSLGILTVNMLAAADSILIPLQCEYYALEGLTQLLSTINLIQHGVNPELGFEGVLLTMYDSRLNLSRQVVADAREYFGPKVFESIVPRNIRLAEAPSFGKPIVRYDVTSAGAQAYLNIARELLERVTGTSAEGATTTESAASVGTMTESAVEQPSTTEQPRMISDSDSLPESESPYSDSPYADAPSSEAPEPAVARGRELDEEPESLEDEAPLAAPIEPPAAESLDEHVLAQEPDDRDAALLDASRSDPAPPVPSAELEIPVAQQLAADIEEHVGEQAVDQVDEAPADEAAVVSDGYDAPVDLLADDVAVDYDAERVREDVPATDLHAADVPALDGSSPTNDSPTTSLEDERRLGGGGGSPPERSTP